MHDVNANVNVNVTANVNANPSEVKGGKRTLACNKLDSWDTFLLLQQINHTCRLKRGLANL